MADKQNSSKDVEGDSDNRTHSSDSERETSRFEATSMSQELSSENQPLNPLTDPRATPASSSVTGQQLRKRGGSLNRAISVIAEVPLRSRSLSPSTRMITSELVPMSSEANKFATDSVVEGAASAVTKSPLRQLGTLHDLRSTGTVCTGISEPRTRHRPRSLPLETVASESISSNRPMSLDEVVRLLQDLSAMEHSVVHSGERRKEFQSLQLETGSSSSSIPDLKLLSSSTYREMFYESLETSDCIQTVDPEGSCEPIIEETGDRVHSRDSACSKPLPSPLGLGSGWGPSGGKKKPSKLFSGSDLGDNHKSVVSKEHDASDSFGLYARLQEMNIQGRSSDIARNSDADRTPETESSVYPHRSISQFEVIPILPGEQSTSSDRRQMIPPPCSRESSPIRRPPTIFESSQVSQDFFGSSNAEIIPTSPEQPPGSLHSLTGTRSRTSVTRLEERRLLLWDARTYLSDLIWNIQNDLSTACLNLAENFRTTAIATSSESRSVAASSESQSVAASSESQSVAASPEYLQITVGRIISIRHLIWDIARGAYELPPRLFRSHAVARDLVSYYVRLQNINDRHSRFLSDLIYGHTIRPTNSAQTIRLAKRVYNYLTALGVALENLLRYMMLIVNNKRKAWFKRNILQKKNPRDDNDDSKGGVRL